jgi:cell division cycle 14
MTALKKGIDMKWFNYKRFDIQEYLRRDKTENGGYNWILPGKMLAFSAPATKPTDMFVVSPAEYAAHFKVIGINCVIRLNKARYDFEEFISNGIDFFDLHFPDGTCPTEELLTRFFVISDNPNYKIAIHCMAGLGRTGVLIAAYIIRNSPLTALEAIAWLRICRTGSIIGP